MSLELTVILKDEERTYRKKYLIYEDVTFGLLVDPIIDRCIKEARVDFQGEPEDVQVRAQMVYK